jgi:hypothetical protein
MLSGFVDISGLPDVRNPYLGYMSMTEPNRPRISAARDSSTNPKYNIIDRGGDHTARESCPQDTEQKDGVRTLEELLVDEMGHGRPPHVALNLCAITPESPA